MKQTFAPVVALLLSVAILMTGSGLQGTLLPVRAGLEAFSTISIGVIGAAYFLGFTLGCLKGGQLVKRVGHVRVFLAMSSLGSVAPLLHGLVLEPATWIFLRCLSGFCFAVLYLVIESWLNERSSNETRGMVFSTYVMINLTVLAVGQMMTLLYPPQGLELFVMASVLVSIGAIPVALSTAVSPELPTDVEVDLRRLFRISPAGTVGCLATGIANGAFWSLAPVFTAGVSPDPALAAWFMSATVVGGALAQWPLGLVSDRLGRRKALAGAAFSGAVVAAVFFLFPDRLGFAGTIALGAAWGFFAFPMYAISVAHTNDNADPADYVMVSSGLLLVYGAGAVAGPFAASALMTVTGSWGLYLLTGIVHLLTAGYVVLRIYRRESTPAEQHITYSDALATAYTASQVYEEEYRHHVEEDAPTPARSGPQP